VERINEFLAENRVAFLVGFLLLVLVCWLHKDNRRNEPVYEDTNATVGRIEERIGNIEQRIDSLQNRVDKAEKTVSGTIVTIRESRENAVTVADGISEAERRLDAIIQRQGRIENILADIETANRSRKKNP
jgi:septal ring factor EnvC (AmiA/AmiB activator)